MYYANVKNCEAPHAPSRVLRRRRGNPREYSETESRSDLLFYPTGRTINRPQP